MATAKLTTKTATKVVEEPDDGVVLELSREEALTLMTILRFVGGSPDDTARRHQETMLEALGRVVPSRNYFHIDRDHLGGIWVTSDLIDGGV